MKFFTVKNLATNRALISIILNLDLVKDLKLTLKKSYITNTWATSKSSRRDIALAAAALADVQIIDIASSGTKNNETNEKTSIPLFLSSEATTYDVSFELTQESFEALKVFRSMLFDNYSIEDFIAFKSKFSLNTLLACIYADKDGSKYLSYKHLRAILDSENDYEHKQAFYRNAVQVAFKDITQMPKGGFKHEPSAETNEETNRPMTYGVNLTKAK